MAVRNSRPPKKGKGRKHGIGKVKESPAGKGAKSRGKNVSFSTKLEESVSIDDVDMTRATDIPKPTSAGRGILKAKREAKDEGFSNSSDVQTSRSLKGGKRKIIVKKSVKEHLLTLSKKDRREYIRSLRAKTKPNFECAHQAKLIWEKLRSSKTSKADKAQLTEQLHGLVKGKTSSVIYAHDTSRVIQCLLATGDENVRNSLFDELAPEIVRMVKSPYARFFVTKILKMGTKQQKNVVFNAFQGHCVPLLRNKWSATILELFFNDVATAEQRTSITKEFYGKEFVIFRDEHGDKQLSDLAQTEPQKVSGIMKNIRDVLNDVIEKGQLKLSLVHKLVLDYITYCTPMERQEMIETIKEFLPEICHTRDGSLVAMKCIWNGDAKQRKLIVKSFKDLSVKAACDRYSKRVLYAMFDAVDDTVLVNKMVVKEIADNVADVIYDANGVHVLHYMVHPRDRRVFGKGMVSLLSEGDGNEYSKKSNEARYGELFNGLKDSLYTFMAANMKEILTNKVSAVLVLDALEPSSSGDALQRNLDAGSHVTPCFDAIRDVCAEELVPHDIREGTPLHIVQGGAGRFVLTKLLKVDVHQQNGAKLSDSLATLPPEQLESFTSLNAGCFDLYHMCLASPAAEQAVQKGIRPESLRSKTFLGAKLLYERLTGRKWVAS